MSTLGTPARDRFAVLAFAMAGVFTLAWFAAVADAHVVGESRVTVALDLIVGFAFVLVSLAAKGTASERLLMGAVGPAWLAGSLFASARSLHQGVLVVALLAFPSGRISGLARQLLTLGAVLVALEVVPQLGVAALYFAVALVAAAAAGRTSAPIAYPAGAGMAVASALVFSWWAVRHSTVVPPLALYDVTLIALALGFVFATHAAARSGVRLADRVLGDAPIAGIPGLRLVLSEVLNDPDLRIHLWDGSTNSYVDVQGSDAPAAQSMAGLAVLHGDEPIARVITSSAALVDAPTAEAVAVAVRLAVDNHQLRLRQAQSLTDLAASRKRLLAATDRERERVAAQLRWGTGTRLAEANRKLAAGSPAGDPDSSAVIEFASSQVAAAADDVHRIVAGAPPEPLGDGRLQAAIATLAALSPAHVTFNMDGDVAAPADVETALFYVCSEALANASKHSGATRVVIDLWRLGTEVGLAVRDNGRGGANAAGSGLQGLADRLAAAGGRLTVESPSGGGTAIAAWVPKRQHS